MAGKGVCFTFGQVIRVIGRLVHQTMTKFMHQCKAQPSFTDLVIVEKPVLNEKRIFAV